MSIFDNVSKPINNEDIRLFVAIKYGQPTHDREWLEKLPEVVTDLAAKGANVSASQLSHETRVTMLSIMLRQPANRDKASSAIIHALVLYHTLYG